METQKDRDGGKWTSFENNNFYTRKKQQPRSASQTQHANKNSFVPRLPTHLVACHHVFAQHALHLVGDPKRRQQRLGRFGGDIVGRVREAAVARKRVALMCVMIGGVIQDVLRKILE